MFHPRRRKLPAIVAGALGVGGVFGLGVSSAGAAEPSQAELMEQIKALNAKVEQLQARQSATQSADRASEVDATVDSVLRDADRRSQLLDVDGFTAGYHDDKFVIQSADGDFSLQPFAQLQIRYTANYREDTGAPFEGGSEREDGLEIRRMRFGFRGNAGDRLDYYFQWESDNDDGGVFLQDAFLTYELNDTWSIKGGQYKDPTFHEELVSSRRQLAVDRSLLNESWAGGLTDRIQGLALIYDGGESVRAEVGVTDGPNSDNTSFVDDGGVGAIGLGDVGWGMYVRGEYKVMGDWGDYDDFTAMGNEDDLLVLGAGAFYAEAGDSDALWHTIDAQYEMGRLGMYGAAIGVYADPGDAGDSTWSYGLLAQAGYMLDDKWEVFGRGSYMDVDEDLGFSSDHFCELTAGVNYYLRGHRAKFTADVTYLPNGTPTDVSGIGVLDPDGDKDQWVLRAQFQLLL